MAAPLSLPLSLNCKNLEVFADSYMAARVGLLAAARATVQVTEQITLVNNKVAVQEGNPLSTECLWVGPASAGNVVVLISATHGVEGFAGAAIQTDLLLRMQAGYSLPANTAILVIFALNPYGFAHCRRCDEQGIDLNRNFIDFSQPLPENTDYQTLMTAIQAGGSASQRRKLLDGYRREWGQTRYEIAISGGQYGDPQGPFFGGTAPAHGRQVIEQVMARYLLAERHLAVVDLHSGLGPYAHGEVINDHPLQSHGFQVANRWYGASVTAPATGDSSSVCKRGLLDYCWHALMQQRGAFVTLEFGSYSTQALFDVILDDHRSWKSGDSDVVAQSAVAMKEHFCPQDSYWRELVLVKARQVIQQALDGLQYE